MSTYVAIGSICWDDVPGDDAPRLGGSVLFSGRVAQAAGWDVSVITSGTPALAAAAREALPGIDVVVQPSADDTVMAFSQWADLGPVAVPTVADPIDLSGSASVLAAADVVHLAPIMGEVTPDHADHVARARFVGITPQGLLRSREPESHRLKLLSSPGTWWATGTHAVVLSESEYDRIAEPLTLDGRALAVTRGENGCFGWCDGEQVDLRGIPVTPAATGAIGAGDVFAASLFIALSSGEPFPAAMDHANRRAAAHVAGDV